jgi:hypothetical protein
MPAQRGGDKHRRGHQRWLSISCLSTSSHRVTSERMGIVARVFSAIPLFRSLSDTEQVVLASSFETLKFSADEIVYDSTSSDIVVAGECGCCCCCRRRCCCCRWCCCCCISLHLMKVCGGAAAVVLDGHAQLTKHSPSARAGVSVPLCLGVPFDALATGRTPTLQRSASASFALKPRLTVGDFVVANAERACSIVALVR